MTLKKFLKPDWRKIALTIILLILGLVYVGWIEKCTPYPCFGGPYSDRGFPLTWLHSNSFSTGIELTNLLLDIISYYLLSIFVIWIYDKSRKVKKK